MNLSNKIFGEDDLIAANFETRELTEVEKVDNEKRLKELFNEKESNGGITEGNS